MQLVLHHQCWMYLARKHLDDILKCDHEHICTVLINDLDQVGTMVSFADDGGRELQVPGVIEDR